MHYRYTATYRLPRQQRESKLVCYRPLASTTWVGTMKSTKAGESKTKLKINHWRSSPGPPELAGFYVDAFGHNKLLSLSLSIINFGL